MACVKKRKIIMKSIKNKALILLTVSFHAVQAGPAASRVLRNRAMVAAAGVAVGALVIDRWTSARFEYYESNLSAFDESHRRLRTELAAFKNENVFTLNECDQAESVYGGFYNEERKIQYTFCRNYGHGTMTYRLLAEEKALSEKLFTIVHTVPIHGSPTVTITKIEPLYDLHLWDVFELNAADIESKIDRSVALNKCPDTVKSSLKKLIEEIRTRVSQSNSAASNS